LLSVQDVEIIAGDGTLLRVCSTLLSPKGDKPSAGLVQGQKV
jgi:hypothetical protein